MDRMNARLVETCPCKPETGSCFLVNGIIVCQLQIFVPQIADRIPTKLVLSKTATNALLDETCPYQPKQTLCVCKRKFPFC